MAAIDTACANPDPGHLLELLRELDCRPDQAVMIGDNENDSAAAAAAGIRFVLVSYGYARTPLAQIKADIRLDRFADIPDAIATLSGPGSIGGATAPGA